MCPPVRSAPLDLGGKVALVTGASRGIGRAVALEFARYGTEVAINNVRSRAEADTIAGEITALGCAVNVVEADVGSPSAVKAMFDETERLLAPVSVLVNCAGKETYGPIDRLTAEEWDRVLAVNLSDPFHCMQRSLETMPTGGSIINIPSIHSSVARKGAADYCASKAGLEMLRKTAALELAPRGIRVNCIAPCAILTEMNEELINHEIGADRWCE